MAIFDWRNFEESAPLAERFTSAEGAVGVELWRELVGELRELVGWSETPGGFDAIGDAFDRFLLAVDSLPRTQLRPATVFVSHRRCDSDKAERVAWEVTEVGFDYWLDIHDPLLNFANTASIPLPVKAILIAAIIEIALLNSSHIVAIQTVASQISHWVPYEFGRAKSRHMVATQAASWFEKGVTPDPRGDYLSLAMCARTKHELLAWLDRQPGAFRKGPNTIWPKLGPPLPDLPN